jgi:chromate transport protein ChrA
MALCSLGTTREETKRRNLWSLGTGAVVNRETTGRADDTKVGIDAAAERESFADHFLCARIYCLTGFERQFLVAVAIGMISPGPVVITVTFVGYLVAGFWGATFSTIGIFLPSFLFVLLVAPILIRHRAQSDVRGFVKGAYAAAIGTILGASVLLSKIAIGDWLTALIALSSLIVLFRWKVSNPMLVAATAIVGIVAFPILKPDWVFVK